MKQLLCVIFLVFLFSCSDNAPESIRSKPQPIQQEESNPLAKVNNVSISLEDVKKEFSMLPPEIQQLYMTSEGMESLLDELIKKELLYQEAVNRGYDKQEKFTRQMEEFNKRLMIEYLLRDEIEKKATVSDKMIKDFYESNKENFVSEGAKDPIEFEKVEDLIRDRLVAEQQRSVFDSYVKTLKEKATIEIDEESIAAALGNSVSPQVGNSTTPQE